MYTKEEAAFIQYWQENRGRRKKLFRQTLISLPLGIVIVIAIFVNYFSGWYKRAAMIANADASLFPVLLIAGIIIVAFIAIFTSYHKYDVNETRYRELLAREKDAVNNHQSN